MQLKPSSLSQSVNLKSFPGACMHAYLLQVLHYPTPLLFGLPWNCASRTMISQHMLKKLCMKENYSMSDCMSGGACLFPPDFAYFTCDECTCNKSLENSHQNFRSCPCSIESCDYHAGQAKRMHTLHSIATTTTDLMKFYMYNTLYRQ